MHDIKNLVSQLSLVARNAERHADKPEFRADMVATLQSSVGKMNDLLARLAQHNKGKPDERVPVALGALLEAVVNEKKLSHRSEEHTSELQSLMRNSYAVFCLKKKKTHEYTGNTRARQ